jgi:WD40 repeat protein
VKSLLLLAMFSSFFSLSVAQTYHVSRTIPLGGSGAWDYLSADVQARRLYVSHSGEVIVLDLDSGKRVGEMNGFGFIHGILIVKNLSTGFLSDGRKNEIISFDPATLAIKGTLKTAANPNSMVYDEATRKLFVGHKPSRSMTVINPATMTIEATIQLGGIPEFPVSDQAGNIFVNIDDKSEITEIDARTLKIKAHWPLLPCQSPSGLAFDRAERRLFTACDDKLMAIVNADTGKVIATVPIGGEPDAARFDPVTHLAFSSNGDGTLTVIAKRRSGRYKVAQTVATEPGARTMALDEKTHTIYLSTAKLGPPPSPTPENPNPPKHPTAVAGSFKLVVVSPVASH